MEDQTSSRASEQSGMVGQASLDCMCCQEMIGEAALGIMRLVCKMCVLPISRRVVDNRFPGTCPGDGRK